MYYPVVGYDDTGGLACNPLLQSFFAGDDPADVSGFDADFSLGDNTIVDEALDNTGTITVNSSYSNGGINSFPGLPWTIQCYFYYDTGGPFTADKRIWAMQGSAADLRLFIITATSPGFERFIYYRNGILFTQTPISSQRVPDQTWTFLACVWDGGQNISVWMDDTRVINSNANIGGTLPTSAGALTLGGSSAGGTTKITDIGVYPCALYTTDTITPPARRGGG